MNCIPAKIKNAAICVIALNIAVFCQSGINYGGRQIFLNGANVAWVNFAGDVGNGTANISAFNQMFADLHKNGGNCMRLWLHTNGAVSPEFDNTGKVTGPGKHTIPDLKQILDNAQKNKISLLLCLWSFDMLRISFGSKITDRAMKMLLDTSYTMAYVDNALIPIVQAVKGHPAILGWEVFNEPEGMSNEFGWDLAYHVPMLNIQRFINLTAGAIHRNDSTALVTNGAWCFKAQSDVLASRKSITDYNQYVNSLSPAQKTNIENEFYKTHGQHYSAEKILEAFSPNDANDKNYYRDDRLINAGGDLQGILDFYTVHYYSWAGVSLSPFHHSASYWKLTKPIAVSEFYIEDTFGVPADSLYPNLIGNNYAGALAWAWYGQTAEQALVRKSAKSLYQYYNDWVNTDPHTGELLYFTSDKYTVEKGDTCSLSWGASKGSLVTLDGIPVEFAGTTKVVLTETTSYKLVTKGELSDSLTLTITTNPSGKILAFTASPSVVASGEETTLAWITTIGSSVVFLGQAMPPKGQIEKAVLADTKFSISAYGQIKDSAAVQVTVRPAETINRSLYSGVYASSTDAGSNTMNMIDANLNTKWVSGNMDQQWVVLNLARQHVIDKIILRWDACYAKKYRIAVSDDSLTWTLIKTNQSGPGGTEILTGLSSKCRYIKLLLDQRSLSSEGFVLAEFEAYGIQNGITNVKSDNGAEPLLYSLQQNYPNPFNPATKIKFSLKKRDFTSLKIYDLTGRLVSTIINEVKNAGNYQTEFNARSLSSGIYFCRLVSGDYSSIIKMLFLK